MGVDRRTLSIAAAVAVLAIVGWNLLGPAPAPVATPATPAASPTSRDEGRTAAPEIVPSQMGVRLEALARQRAEPGEAGRNPFRFQARVAAPAEGVTPTTGTAPAVALPPPGPPPLPPIPLKFIGLVERADGAKWAVLSDSRGPLHGREGDTIDGRYLIVKIGIESIEMAYADGRGKQTIRLTGQ